MGWRAAWRLAGWLAGLAGKLHNADCSIRGSDKHFFLPNPYILLDFSKKMCPAIFKIDRSRQCGDFALCIFSNTDSFVPKLVEMLDFTIPHLFFDCLDPPCPFQVQPLCGQGVGTIFF